MKKKFYGLRCHHVHRLQKRSQPPARSKGPTSADNRVAGLVKASQMQQNPYSMLAGTYITLRLIRLCTRHHFSTRISETQTSIRTLCLISKTRTLEATAGIKTSTTTMATLKCTTTRDNSIGAALNRSIQIRAHHSSCTNSLSYFHLPCSHQR
jgi:hypothetical protein